LTGFESKKLYSQEVEIAELKNSLAMLGQKKTLRDEFAMAALTGMLCSIGDQNITAADLATFAYHQADVMMKARQ
jgi:hypothetical protein